MTRRGKTLVELLVVISAISFVMMAVGRMTVAMMRAETAQSAAMRRQSATARLASRFRDDAHEAVRAEAEPGKGGATKIEFVLPEDRRVVYSMTQGGAMTRTVLGKENEKPEAVDAWPVDGEAPPFSLSDDKSTATLVVERGTQAGGSGGASTPSGIALRVEAAVGLNRRMAGGKAP